MATERTLTRRSSWAERAQPLTRNPAGAAAVALGGLLLVSIGVRIWLSSKIATPWILIDEYVYSELAKSFATSGLFLVRGAPSGVNNVVYPALISPAWLAHPMGTTYALANVINVVLMTATAIPLYLWARKLVAPVFALVAVALTFAAGVHLHGHADDGERLPAGVRPCGLCNVPRARAADAMAPAGRVRGDPARGRDPLPGTGPAGRAAGSCSRSCSSSAPSGARSRGRSCGASSGDTGSRWRCSWEERCLLYVAFQAARGHTLRGGLGGIR